MIVKNEEDWIENALASVRSVVDEIIIADMGSTDHTIEKAARFSPKVLHFKWTDSFADARNFALAEARHPWILVLDADECIAARDLPLIEKAIQKRTDGYYLNQRSYVFGDQIVGWTSNSGEREKGKSYPSHRDHPLTRLFRNHPEIQFRGAVHEIVDPARINQSLRFDSLPVALLYAAVSEKLCRRYVRALDLLLRARKLGFDSFEVRPNQRSKALATLGPTSIEDTVARSPIDAALSQQGSIDEAQSHLEWAIRHDRSLVDAGINQSHIYSRKGDFGKAERFRFSAVGARVEMLVHAS